MQEIFVDCDTHKIVVMIENGLVCFEVEEGNEEAFSVSPFWEIRPEFIDRFIEALEAARDIALRQKEEK